MVSREGHAWILADLARDPQVAVAAAAELAEGMSSAMALGPIIQMFAYSDGSVIWGGVEGSAVAIVCVNGTAITATVRLAAAYKPLSSGRSEWTGLLLVLCIVRRVQAHVALRLGNLQVVTRSATAWRGTSTIGYARTIETWRRWPGSCRLNAKGEGWVRLRS